MAIRKSIRELSTTERSDFTSALLYLKHERVGPDSLSTYDRYTMLQDRAMMQSSPWTGGLTHFLYQGEMLHIEVPLFYRGIVNS